MHFLEVSGSFLSKLLKNEHAFHLKVSGSHEKRITYVTVGLFLCILRFCASFFKIVLVTV